MHITVNLKSGKLKFKSSHSLIYCWSKSVDATHHLTSSNVTCVLQDNPNATPQQLAAARMAPVATVDRRTRCSSSEALLPSTVGLTPLTQLTAMRSSTPSSSPVTLAISLSSFIPCSSGWRRDWVDQEDRTLLQQLNTESQSLVMFLSIKNGIDRK